MTPTPTDSELPSPSTQAPSTGVVVLSVTRRVLHINLPAVELLERLFEPSGLRTGSSTMARLFPQPITAILEEFLNELEKRIAGEQWMQFEIKRALQHSARLLTLRAFGIPDAHRRQQSRLVITLQETLPA